LGTGLQPLQLFACLFSSQCHSFRLRHCASHRRRWQRRQQIKLAAREMTALLFVMGVVFIGYAVAFQMAFGAALPQYR
jgi:hypothetical protein